jgi:sigma-E factor negative regulatory protein RseC
MEQEAVVARVEGDLALIEVGGVAGGCGRCHEAGGCQSGLLTRLFRPEPKLYSIVNSIGARPGDRVVVRVRDGATLRAAALAYVLPVLFLIGGAALGTALGGAGDGAAALGALLGLGIGIAAAAGLRRGGAGTDRPVLVCKSSGICNIKETCND